jgi:hypothetical protein
MSEHLPMPESRLPSKFRFSIDSWAVLLALLAALLIRAGIVTTVPW